MAQPTKNNNNLQQNALTDFEDQMFEFLSKHYSPNEEDSILFKDPSKDNWEEDPILSSLKHIDDEGTIEERAENLKHHGNNEFKAHNYRWDKAIEFYTQAIQLGSSNKKAMSVYYANRAAVNLAKGNYRRVIEDCVEAIKHDDKNVKAYWRHAKASIELGKYKQSIQQCQIALQIEPENKALKAELTKATKKREQKQALKQKKQKELEAKKEVTTKKTHLLMEEFEKRGIQMGKPLYDVQRQYEVDIHVDEQGALHWPVMLLYEEYNQSEFIKDFNENHTFAEHLAYMFPPDYIAAWDTEHKYKLADLEIYLEANCTEPLKPLNKSMKKRWIINNTQDGAPA
eukprot:CAMPEP_0168550526 /NCGR_PEP_ID=MMETSP0413-20121227/5691_1 /TAXON_ID=136452 /ORGANISM="Filamoeba nolandi, Strain NC-AS-23-1" /LENGTH=341 /DNA_ID=CAMNT_0008581001 /DNA_START=35 /DNA_END=1060 /DNA_ORIENTATION=+